MKQCPVTKTLLTKERVQPIIPVSLVTSLGYQLTWQENNCRMSHPSRADLPVQLVQGCPTVEYSVGMKLFREVEESQKEQCWIKAVLTGQEDAGKDQRLEDLRRLFPEVPHSADDKDSWKERLGSSSIAIQSTKEKADTASKDFSVQCLLGTG